MHRFINYNKYTLTQKIAFILFMFVYGLVKYLPGILPGDLFRWLVLKIFLNKLKSWRISDGVTIWYPSGISIGKKVIIGEYCFLDGYGGIDIGDWTIIAHNCSILSESHGFDIPNHPIYYQMKKKSKVKIGKDVWLGCGVRVLQGVQIGNGAIIGAGSVVNCDIPSYSIAVGVPAKIVGYRN